MKFRTLLFIGFFFGVISFCAAETYTIDEAHFGSTEVLQNFPEPWFMTPPIT
jgi:hypothetical protein